MINEKQTGVWLKDLVQKLDGETLRDVADVELKLQGWQGCDKEELADLVVKHVVENPLNALRLNLVMLPLELHETYDEMIAGNAVEVPGDDEFLEWYAEEFYIDLQPIEGSDTKQYTCRMAEEVRAAIKAAP